MTTRKSATPGSRRTCLAKAAAAVAGAGTLGAPVVVRAQGSIQMRWQSTWPEKDIFHESARDFATKVTDMTGGLNITLFSYHGSLDFGLIACREMVPDVWNLVRYLAEALDELVALLPD